MEIVTRGHDAKNAVMQIMQLFFSLSDNVKVTSVLCEDKTARAYIEAHGKTAFGEAFCEKNEKLYVTNTIKKSVLYAAKKLSDMPSPWGISTGIRPAKTARKMLDDNIEDADILLHLTGEYLMDTDKANLALSVAKAENRILKSMPKNSVSIYVGIPFCPSRCAYCSFISQATEHNRKYIEPYVEALEKEIEYTAKIVNKLNMSVDTVYFGGGTPTAIKPELLERIIDRMYDAFDLSKVREFTIEAGRPDTFTPEMMRMLKKQKVDRISINPQTMHQETLDTIGRRHSVNDVRRAFYLAREAGIESVNADLIAALPGEDEKMMRQTVREILLLGPDAVTVHTLYMKRASEMIDDFERLRFAQNARFMVQSSAEMLKNAGFMPYYMYKQRNTVGNLENVGFAKDGHESLYNVYIMEEVQPIIALGAGGSTKMVDGETIERVYNPKEAADYVHRIDEVLERKNELVRFYDK